MPAGQTHTAGVFVVWYGVHRPREVGHSLHGGKNSFSKPASLENEFFPRYAFYSEVSRIIVREWGFVVVLVMRIMKHSFIPNISL